MRLLLTILAGCGTMAASISNVQVTGATNTQAVLQYDPPDASTCRVEVSLNSNFLPLVNDVDPAKFSGADQDSRPGSTGLGRTRQFVAGKRAAETALDGRKYSRALQANATHYFRVTCQSTGDQATGQFQTTNIPLGNTFSDPEPVDTSQPGSYAWPSMNLTDRKETYIDPFTGVLLRRVSLPTDRNITLVNQPFAFARSTAWVNPDAAISNADGGAGATISGKSSGKLLLLPQYENGNFNYITTYLKGSRAYNLHGLNYFQAVLTASTNLSSCNSTTSDDCKIQVCLSLDGVTCYGGSQVFEQALTTTPANYSFGSTTGVDLWQNGNTMPPTGSDIAIRQGTVNCNGTNQVTWTGGDYFGEKWAAGSTLTINGTDYSILPLNSLTTIQVSPNCPSSNGANVAYVAVNFGVLINKKTSASNSVTVSYIQANYQVGTFPIWDYSGAFDLCGPTPVLGANGDAGYNCSTLEQGVIYWVDGTTAEAHMIARNSGGNCGAFDSVIFDSSDPDTFYCGGSLTRNANGVPLNSVPERVKYFGNHLEPQNTQYPGHFEEGENLPNCNAISNPTNQPCLLWTNLTGPTDMVTLSNQFDPSFDPVKFNNFYLVGVEDRLLVFRVWRGNYGSLGWTVLFDPSATANYQPGNAGCIGGGNPGCVVGAVPSWNRPGARWCALKSNDPIYQPGWMAIGPYLWSVDSDTNPGVGPYLSTVADGTAFSNLTGQTGGPNTCPTNPYGLVGQQCTTVTVDGEPRDPSPCVASLAACYGSLETGQAGELGSTAPGDFFQLQAPSGGYEIMQLIGKSGGNNQTWTFQRGLNNALISTAANPKLYTYCNANPLPARIGVASGEWYWNYGTDPHGYNSTGSTILGDPFSVGAHFFFQNGVNATSYTEDPRCKYGVGYACYQTRIFPNIPTYVQTPAMGIPTLNPFFAGKFGPADGNLTQTHPAGPGLNASPQQQTRFYDGRPFNGGPISGSAKTDGDNPATLVGGQLYKFTAAQTPNLDRKFLPTFAFVGRKPLLDISSPATGNQIGTGASDAYKYCVSAAANECVTGSNPGDVYVNAPFVNRAFCHFPAQATGAPDDYDICIGNNAMVYNSIMEIAVNGVDNEGKNQRVITKAMARNRLLAPFWHTHGLANAQWMLLKTDYAAEFMDAIFAVQEPPPATQDSLSRNNFQTVLVSVTPDTNLKVNNATIEFGYSEDGDSSKLFCTTRAETCAVGRASASGTIDQQNPFYFEQAEASSLAGTPCANGCSIAAPGISGRVLYYRVVYRDSAKNVLSRGPIRVQALQ